MNKDKLGQIPKMETQAICKSCGEYVECEDITGLLCSDCWLIDQEEQHVAHLGSKRIEDRIKRSLEL